MTKYTNFDHKLLRFTDAAEFSWSNDGYDIFKVFIPQTTKIITD